MDGFGRRLHSDRAYSYYKEHLEAGLLVQGLAGQVVAVDPDSGRHAIGASPRDAEREFANTYPGRTASLIEIGGREVLHVGHLELFPAGGHL